MPELVKIEILVSALTNPAGHAAIKTLTNTRRRKKVS